MSDPCERLRAIVRAAQALQQDARFGITTTPLIDQPGLIAVVAHDRGCYGQFMACLSLLTHPSAGAHVLFAQCGGGGIAQARNLAVEEALGRPGIGWILFIDDDHLFSPDALMRLLRHNADICVPMMAIREAPFRWVAWEPTLIDQDTPDAIMRMGVRGSSMLDHVKPGQRGLIEIGAAGTGMMLIAMRVFHKLEPPWFEFGRFGSDTPGEDVWFCLRARRAGFRVWCDLDVRIGHLMTAAVWPQIHADGTVGHALETEHNDLTIARHQRDE